MSSLLRLLVCLFALTALLAGCGSGATESARSDTEGSTSLTAVTDTSAVPSYRDGTIYKGGTFDGVGYGKNGSIHLSVTIDNDKIIAIELISHSDTDSFFDRAYDSVTSALLDKVNPDLSEVDSVSGATLSSQGVIDAIKAALYKARL
ncbi:MAG: FMN-binding protein [Eubacteriales bacterium]